MPRVKIRIDDWDHFKSVITRLASKGHDGHPLSEIIFRGQALGSYTLRSSLDRANSTLDVGIRNQIQAETCMQFRQRNPELTDGMEDDQVLALLQHNGCPTRLLDWSTTPYVAAFFAASDTLSATSDEDEFAVWALWRSSPAMLAGAGVGVSEPSVANNARSKAQRGLFTTNNSLYATLNDYIDAWDEGGKAETSLWQFLIPRREAVAARRDLWLMGIDYERIFPDLTGAARASYASALEVRAMTE